MDSTGIGNGVKEISVIVENNGCVYKDSIKITFDQPQNLHNVEKAEISIYPNPVKDVLRIESGELRINQVEIVDLSGKTVCQFNNLKNQISVSALSQEIYFVKTETDKRNIIKKIVIE